MMGIAGKTSERLRLLVCLSFLLGLGFSGCGGAGSGTRLGPVISGGNQAKYGLQIEVPRLPAAHVGEPLQPVQLRVLDGAPEDLDWSIWDGTPPDGVVLDAAGRLSGTPHARGVHVFSVHVTDGYRAGVATLALAVDEFGLFACAGLTAGDAWQGQAVVLSAVGGTGTIAFDAVQNESGGRWRETQAAATRAVWMPGRAGGDACVDQLRARDVETGQEALLSLTVRPDPTEGHDAEFGSSDVWHVNWERKTGTHPFATDFQAALARVGLRAETSTDRVGRPIDRLTEIWLRVETLRQLNRIFLRQPDGSAGENGLPVSFPFHEPGVGYGKPIEGAVSANGPGRYNEISVLDGRSGAILGTAFTDDATNRLHENDTTAQGGDLGVFINVLMKYYDIMYDPTPTRSTPVGETDLPSVQALLQGSAAAGPRYHQLAKIGRQFAFVLAVVLAHEIGHSLGLQHSDVPGADTIMSTRAPISPWAKPAFSAANVAALSARLPGPGRYATGVSTQSGTPEGGVHVCAGHVCNLRVPPLPSPPLPSPPRR